MWDTNNSEEKSHVAKRPLLYIAWFRPPWRALTRYTVIPSPMPPPLGSIYLYLHSFQERKEPPRLKSRKSRKSRALPAGRPRKSFSSYPAKWIYPEGNGCRACPVKSSGGVGPPGLSLPLRQNRKRDFSTHKARILRCRSFRHSFFSSPSLRDE